MSEDRRAPNPEKTGSLGVIEQMIFTELQRVREGNDKVLAVLAGLDKNLALLSIELAHVRAEVVRAHNRIDGHGESLARLTMISERADERQSVFGWFVKSPLIGWLTAAAALGWAELNRRGV